MKCKDCRWWERIPDSVTGQCRGKMPELVDAETFEGGWPIVHEEDWCACFDPKEMKLDETEIKVSEK